MKDKFPNERKTFISNKSHEVKSFPLLSLFLMALSIVVIAAYTPFFDSDIYIENQPHQHNTRP